MVPEPEPPPAGAPAWLAELEPVAGPPYLRMGTHASGDAWLTTTGGDAALLDEKRRVLAEHHDEAVGQVSHIPQLMSALVAGGLLDLPPEHLRLAGQGLRDVTRDLERHLLHRRVREARPDPPADRRADAQLLATGDGQEVQIIV